MWGPCSPMWRLCFNHKARGPHQPMQLLLFLYQSSDLIQAQWLHYCLVTHACSSQHTADVKFLCSARQNWTESFESSVFNWQPLSIPYDGPKELCPSMLLWTVNHCVLSAYLCGSYVCSQTVSKRLSMVSTFKSGRSCCFRGKRESFNMKNP